ncbi:TetR/AcrR family transcriptional regulator [Alcanivorax sp. S6407]|uniref:TetR/AcrR family transcriptional regulator n=1 Tax=Alcanivorax sp. S6407 TaxID=2926424 RepID=UPI001FF46821|nr:TetR/AcrR family transcriptional regulator [Alcanivorax sp. S6407]MCK0153391.1 TetR/AcrR family transcriptional regulator [Alcanivorax sp. S6407]
MRRIPRQQRSREMVARIIDAVGEVLAERGLDNMTTNHVADAAGVSIGSLYQYFSDKDELVEALLESLSKRVTRDFHQQSVKLNMNTLPLRQLVELAIRYGMQSIRTNPLMYELARNWQRLPFDRLLEPLSQFFQVMAQPYFLKNYQNYPVENLQAKLYVLVHSTLFTSVHYLVQDVPTISEDELIATLTEMIVGMLEPPATGAG